METVHFRVAGLVNAESRTKILNSLDKIQGVQEVAVDVSRGTVEVEFNDPATTQQIEQCIENTGYYIR